MKLAVVCLLAFAAVVFVAARPEEKYTNKFDHIDVDQILQSDRLLGNYFKCLMEEGRCTAEGTELKKILPDALATECSKCSDTQKEMSKKVIKFLSTDKPEMWKKLLDKYDPEKKYRTKFGDEAQKYGITV